MTFGEKLQQLRKQSAMSQEELAAKLGVSRQAVSKWELDASLPDTENVVQISDLFVVSTDYLLKDAAPQEIQPQTPVQAAPTPLRRGLLAKCMMLAGGLGILAFWILSSVFPCVASFDVASKYGNTSHAVVKTGLPAFLSVHNMQLLFALCCAAFAVGILLCCVPYIKNRVNRKRDDPK